MICWNLNLVFSTLFIDGRSQLKRNSTQIGYEIRRKDHPASPHRMEEPDDDEDIRDFAQVHIFITCDRLIYKTLDGALDIASNMLQELERAGLDQLKVVSPSLIFDCETRINISSQQAGFTASDICTSLNMSIAKRVALPTYKAKLYKALGNAVFL